MDIQRAVENNQPAMPEMMAEIAEKEIEEVEQAIKKKHQKSWAEDMVEEDDNEKDDDYDNFVSFFNTLCNLFL